MHIITTAYTKSWPKSIKNSILLGKWCINKESRNIYKVNKPQILDYHYDNRKNLYTSIPIINNIYFDLLKTISITSNKLFNKNNNIKYWEIIWGHWLHTFVSVLYDRNLSIKNVIQKYPDSNTNILDKKSFFIANNSRDYLDNVQNDLYNFQLFSSLWNFYSGKINKSIKIKNIKNLKENKSSFINKFFKSIKNIIYKIIFKNSNTVIFHSGFSKFFILKLILFTKFKVYPYELIEPQISKKINNLDVDYLLRKKLKKKLIKHKVNNNDFYNLCLELISDNAPLSILEGYQTTLLYNKRNTQYFNYLFSSGACLKDSWNILCAENIKNKKSKIINLQHGGGYGIQLFSDLEDYEIRISDLFITMGWGYNKKFFEMPSPVINKLIKNNNFKKNKILIIGNGYPRYFYRLFSHPIGKYVNIYNEWFDIFLSNINKNISNNIIVRLYSVDQSGTHDILKKKHSNFHFNNKVSFNNQLLNCKIAVSDTNQTTYLQSLALNIPTIVYWNPDSTEVSEKSKPYLFELSKASILHYSPTSASNFLNDNYENIYDWWKSDIVQKARKNFINNYAKTCKDWDKSWFAFFKKINEFV